MNNPNRRWRLLGTATIVSLMLGVLGLTCASKPSRTLGPMDIARLRMVVQTDVSPDGQSVAYLLRVPRDLTKDDDGKHWTELWVAGPAPDRQRPFVTGEVNVHSPRFIDNGAAIAFSAKRSGDEHNSVYRIPIDGGEARRIASHATDIGAFDLTADGTQIAFTATAEPDEAHKALEDKGFTAKVVEEDLNMVRLWIGTPDSEEPARMLPVYGSVSSVLWDPEGKRIAVVRAPTPLIDDQYMSRDIDIVNAKTGVVMSHLELPGKLGSIEWSPDGEHVAVIAGEDAHDPRAGRLWLWPSRRPDKRDLLPDYAGHVSQIAWRDAQTIAFVGEEGTTTTVETVDIASGTRTVVIPGGGPILESLSLSADGKTAAFAADTASHPGEVFVWREVAGALERWSNSNPQLAELPLARQEVVKFAARDGLEIEGVLIRPLDEKPGRRYPLIMVVHGGPESHISNGWLTRYSYPGQVAAARGFAVFYPNYRGSTGRGVEFSKKGQSDYAGSEFDDLVDAIAHLVETGLVDKARVGITGGSYGGFAAAWGATKLTEHFAASVMFVGISDHISKAGQTDIPNEMYLVHSRRWPWEHWEFFRERSPLFYVQQARTPLLIMHGEEDPRVPVGQSKELFRFLKLIDETPVRLVLYPGEGHGNRRIASRLDYSIRMMRWMEHYLKGRGGEPPNYSVASELKGMGIGE